MLEEFVGVARTSGQPGWPHTPQYAVVAALAGVWLTATLIRIKGIGSALIMRRSGRRPADLVIFIVPIAIAEYLASNHSWYRETPRYLFVLYPLFSIGLVLAARASWRYLDEALGRRHTPHRIRLALGSVASATAAVVVLATTLSFVQDQRRYNGTTDAQLRAGAGYLLAHNLDNAYADYWTALPALYFGHSDRLHVAPWGVGVSKFPDERRAVDASPHWVYIASSRSGVNYNATLRPGARTPPRPIPRRDGGHRGDLRPDDAGSSSLAARSRTPPDAAVADHFVTARSSAPALIWAARRDPGRGGLLGRRARVRREGPRGSCGGPTNQARTQVRHRIGDR